MTKKDLQIYTTASSADERHFILFYFVYVGSNEDLVFTNELYIGIHQHKALLYQKKDYLIPFIDNLNQKTNQHFANHFGRIVY